MVTDHKKRKLEDLEETGGDVEINQVISELEQWVMEIREVGLEEETSEEDQGEAWDDVHGGVLPLDGVKEARMEEVGFMEKGTCGALNPSRNVGIRLEGIQ